MNPVAAARVALVFGGIAYKLIYDSPSRVHGGGVLLDMNTDPMNRTQSTLTQSFSTKLHQDDYIDLFI